MAEEDEEAQKAAAEEEKVSGRRTVEKPFSLHPLTFEEAVGELLKVKPETGKRKNEAG